jgi:hypothetical protein
MHSINSNPCQVEMSGGQRFEPAKGTGKVVSEKASSQNPQQKRQRRKMAAT